MTKEQARENIATFIKEHDYTYSVDDIVDSYENYWLKNMYTSFTTSHCIRSMKAELDTILKDR